MLGWWIVSPGLSPGQPGRPAAFAKATPMMPAMENFAAMSQPGVLSCRLPERLRCAYFAPMKTFTLELPDPLAAALDDAVVDGGFRDAGEVAREALRDYLSHRRFALQERHQMDDIAAALAEVEPPQPSR